ncbi:MAG TPA: glycosyltransferase [Bryobacteraceae bacterium]|nr:glycosyltransferase [Bryobacteraceae bacterium]
MSQPKRIDFLFFDAGGGHRSAAVALKTVTEERYRGWEIRLLNLQEVLDTLDIFRKVTGIRLQDIYNLLLKHGWTLGAAHLLRMMHLVIRIYHRSQVKALVEVWRRRRPELVVSLIPNFNRPIFESLHQALPGTELVTVLTDLADYPPHFWIEKQPQYFVCGTDRAVQQAAAMGHPLNRIYRVSGMILRPGFYETREINRAEQRGKLGLADGLPTGLVLFGGQGSDVMRDIAERLGNSALDLQLIVICGHNAKLKARLEQLQTRNRIHVEGFTERIPELMQLADFFIGKPGPGSISEAIHMGLPAIVEKNAWTLPQERYNAEWLKEQGLGLVLKDFRQVEAAVGELLRGGKLQEMRRRATQLSNQAVFEIAGILGEIGSKVESLEQRQ